MQPTAGEWKYIQSWIGTTETQAVFTERLTRLAAEIDWDERGEPIDAAIEESMRSQLAEMEFDQPGSVTLPGGLTASYGENMRGLKDRIKEFTGGISRSGQTTVNITRLVRDPRR